MIIIEMGLKFNSLQIEGIADFFRNLSLLFLASFVIPELFSVSENILRMITGISASMFCLILSVLILEGSEKND